MAWPWLVWPYFRLQRTDWNGYFFYSSDLWQVRSILNDFSCLRDTGVRNVFHSAPSLSYLAIRPQLSAYRQIVRFTACDLTASNPPVNFLTANHNAYAAVLPLSQQTTVV